MDESLPNKEPAVNFAIGPSCPVRCEGCYNHFGMTATRGGLVTVQEVVNFASLAIGEGVQQATISGGDPLVHPDIVQIVSGLKDLGLKIKLDTVGTSLIEDAPIAYKGKGESKQVNIHELAPHIDYVNIPLDGANQETISKFRKGRQNLFAETLVIANLLRKAGIVFGFNTVANNKNISELPEILEIVEGSGAHEWQIFEFDPEGPNPSRYKNILLLPTGQFEAATAQLQASRQDLEITAKSLAARSEKYFLIDDSGLAWVPRGEGERQILGHISHDKHQVLGALRKHISQLKP